MKTSCAYALHLDDPSPSYLILVAKTFLSLCSAREQCLNTAASIRTWLRSTAKEEKKKRQKKLSDVPQ